MKSNDGNVIAVDEDKFGLRVGREEDIGKTGELNLFYNPIERIRWGTVNHRETKPL